MSLKALFLFTLFELFDNNLIKIATKRNNIFFTEKVTPGHPKHHDAIYTFLMNLY